MDQYDIDSLLELGRINPKQFEKNLHLAAKRNVNVSIDYVPLMKLPDELIICYLNYVDRWINPLSQTRLALKQSAVWHTSDEKDASTFKRNCRLLKYFKMDDILLKRLPYHQVVDNTWFSVVNKALKWLTFEELKDLVDMKDEKMMGYIRSGIALHYAVQNDDTRVYDFFYERFIVLDVAEQIEQIATVVKKDKVNSRSVLKFYKLQLSIIGHALRLKIETFENWSLLGYLSSGVSSSKLIDELSCGQYDKKLLTGIAIKGERAIACLNSRLPKVLVEMVLQYLL